MPYISTESRLELAARGYPRGAGELNFVLTQVCMEYLNHSEDNYQAHNDIIGALTACQLEWYRRVTVPYEDSKIRENGDVYYDEPPA